MRLLSIWPKLSPKASGCQVRKKDPNQHFAIILFPIIHHPPLSLPFPLRLLSKSTDPPPRDEFKRGDKPTLLRIPDTSLVVHAGKRFCVSPSGASKRSCKGFVILFAATHDRTDLVRSVRHVFHLQGAFHCHQKLGVDYVNIYVHGSGRNTGSTGAQMENN